MVAELQGQTMSSADPNEREWLLRHRDGDPEAFARLVAEYRAPVYSYLVRCGVSPADRDDLFQEVFIKVHAAAQSYDAGRPLHPWLFTIVANTVRNHHRRRRVRELLHLDGTSHEASTSSADGETVAAARQTVAWLEEEIGRLPQVQREVLILVCIENLAQKEAASALGLPVNTVKTHLRRARLTLVRKLARRNTAGTRGGAS